MPQKYRRRSQPDYVNDPRYSGRPAVGESYWQRKLRIRKKWRRVVDRVVEQNRRMAWMRKQFGSVYNYVQARQMRP